MFKKLSILIVVGVLFLSVSPLAYAKPAEWTTMGWHVVKTGETLYCIARAYGVSPWSLAAHNGIVSPNLIYPGQVLAVPNAYAPTPAGPTCVAQFSPSPVPSPPGCGCATSHTVVASENLYRISLYYGVSMWRVAECNGITNLNYVRVGQVLRIPSGS